jgi:hypothetical protein
MRFLCLLAFSVLAAVAAAAENVSAIEAIKLLPKEQRKLVARIEARDGTLAPERWYVLVHDPTAENGLREFVVAGREIVANRTISQFAESVSAEQTLGDAVKFDSNSVAKLAQQFAQANEATIATIDYELRKDGKDGVPLWRLSCMDAEGRQVGALTVTATKGAVISHQGFAHDPSKERAERTERTVTARERYRTSGNEPLVRDQPPQFPPPLPPPPPPRRTFIDRLFNGRPPDR